MTGVLFTVLDSCSSILLSAVCIVIIWSPSKVRRSSPSSRGSKKRLTTNVQTQTLLSSLSRIRQGTSATSHITHTNQPILIRHTGTPASTRKSAISELLVETTVQFHVHSFLLEPSFLNSFLPLEKKPFFFFSGGVESERLGLKESVG